MKPTKQTVLHDPANGKHGNCLSAVLASLLHLPIEDVPVFSEPHPDDTGLTEVQSSGVFIALEPWRVRTIELHNVELTGPRLVPTTETGGCCGSGSAQG